MSIIVTALKYGDDAMILFRVSLQLQLKTYLCHNSLYERARKPYSLIVITPFMPTRVCHLTNIYIKMTWSYIEQRLAVVLKSRYLKACFCADYHWWQCFICCHFMLQRALQALFFLIGVVSWGTFLVVVPFVS